MLTLCVIVFAIAVVGVIWRAYELGRVHGERATFAGIREACNKIKWVKRDE